VPKRPRRLETVDGDQHLLDLRPMPMQRHRVASRGPGVAEADHAADIFQPQHRVDDWQREDHVLAGIHRAILLQNFIGRDAACDHRVPDDLAFRNAGTRRHAAADDRPAKHPFAPEPMRFVDTKCDILAGAEHEQEIRRIDRRADQMPGIDVGDFRLGRQPCGIVHGPPRSQSDALMPRIPGSAKSIFIALDCEAAAAPWPMAATPRADDRTCSSAAGCA